MLSFALDGSRLIMINERGETQKAFDDGISVLLSVDKDGIILHKIGTPEMVRDVKKDWTTRMWEGILGYFVVVDLPKDTPVDELNKIWHNTGYIELFLKQNGVDLLNKEMEE
jgi:hypothetical protein